MHTYTSRENQNLLECPAISRAATQQQYLVILSQIKLPIFDETIDDY